MSAGRAWVAGTGRWLPETVLTNAELGAAAGVDEEWILQRTGIHERRVADADTGTAVMAARAGSAALDAAGMPADRVELIIVATSTPDHLTPPSACEVQAALGSPAAACFDIEGGFAGWIYALITAEGLIRAGTVRNALVVGADKLSTVTDRSDPNTGPLFGDGAGALVLTSDAGSHAVRATSWWADGSLADVLRRPSGGSRRPFDATVLEERSHLLRMEGTRLFRPAVRVMAEQARRALALAGVDVAEVGLIVPHQANLRIIQALTAELELDPVRVFVNIERYGNTGAATVPIALHEALETGAANGERPVLLVSFGAGATAGAALLESGAGSA
ncbi:MAG TPA: beta-ketoacyl-ACP synthase 3 [Longimicrobiales bacterium]|nr:beta-ketoacyl-ACP synthase 3 [Longimicrobiales bacterium]